VHTTAEALPSDLTLLRAHELTPARFGGPDRTLAYLDTDAEAYQPGETMHARVLLLGSLSHAPRLDAEPARIALYRPDGTLEGEVRGTSAPSFAASFALPITATEGEYALVVDFAHAELAPVRKALRVTRAPPLGKGEARARTCVTLHAESGAVLTGVASRLYVEATRGTQAWSGLTGRIVSAEGTRLASFETDSDGRARLTCTPDRNTWRVELDAVTDELVVLPTVVRDGWSLTTLAHAFDADAPVRVRVACVGPARRGRVALAMRECEVASRAVTLDANGSQEVELTPPSYACGALRLVAYDETDRACAERLVFRHPARTLRVEVIGRATGAGVAVNARVTDVHGEPVDAIVLVSACDAERRAAQPGLPARVLLEEAVRAVEDPERVLADARQIDLLLGVQSWRRFGFYHPDDFLREHGAAAARVLGASWPIAPTDPELRLTRAILEMNVALLEAKKYVALAIADEKRLEKQVEVEKSTAEEWSEKVKLARRAGDDALAEEAHLRQQDHLQVAAELDAQWHEQLAAVAELKDALRALNHQVEAAKRKKNVLIARLKRVEATVEVRAALSRVDGRSVRRELEEVEAWIRAREEALGVRSATDTAAETRGDETTTPAPKLPAQWPDGSAVQPRTPAPYEDPDAPRPETAVALWSASATDAQGHVMFVVDPSAKISRLRVRLDVVAEDGALATAETIVAVSG
jgi:phage shock protein A